MGHSSIERAKQIFWAKTYTSVQSRTGTDEETSTNRATNGNHVEMARLHPAIQLNDAGAVVALLERLGAETHANAQRLLLGRGGNAFRKGSLVVDGADDIALALREVVVGGFLDTAVGGA